MIHSAMRKKDAIVIRHLGFEDLGTLGPVLLSRNYDIRYFEAGGEMPTLPDVIQTDLLVILGGPISVYEIGRYPFLVEEFEFIHARLIARKPMLGICLGAQMIAKALGAEVMPMRLGKEIGFSPLKLTFEGTKSVLKNIDDSTQVLHWHGDQFSIPPNAQLLAGTDHCPHQAFSVDDYILCLQFHLEFDQGSLEKWLIGHATELHLVSANLHTLRNENTLHGNSLAKASRRTFNAWLEKAEKDTSWKV